MVDMKRSLVLLLVLGLLFGSLVGAADAKKKKKKAAPVKVTREATGTYDAPTLVIAGACAQDGAVGCVSFPAGTGEAYVTVDVVDSTGTPVSASIQQDTNGDGQEDNVLASFCGKTDAPVAFDPSFPVDVWVENVPNPDGPCQAVATSGTVNVVFSNMP
jgi:hypothetical protein